MYVCVGLKRGFKRCEKKTLTVGSLPWHVHSPELRLSSHRSTISGETGTTRDSISSVSLFPSHFNFCSLFRFSLNSFLSRSVVSTSRLTPLRSISHLRSLTLRTLFLLPYLSQTPFEKFFTRYSHTFSFTSVYTDDTGYGDLEFHTEVHTQT